jgi:NADH-quinone oxidoreductase subunit A
MIPLAAYVLLFLAVGVGFIFVHLLAGKFIRPSKPDPEKGTTYECGEPTIGTAWVQFDLRFYVVALLFVIFDVEVAFFFPWAEVFGKANAVARAPKPTPGDEAALRAYATRVLDLAPPAGSESQRQERQRYEEMLAGEGELREGEYTKNRKDASNLAWLAFVEILIFFGVLLVGFAYLWRRGDLAWVRSVGARQAPAGMPLPPPGPASTSIQELAGAGRP